MDRLDLRVSDEERQQVAERLQRAVGEGRLEMAEYDDRVQAAYKAKTYRDLAALTSDLPGVAAPERSALAPVSAVPAESAAEAPPEEPVGRPRYRGPLHPLFFMLILFAGIGLVVSMAGGHGFPYFPIFPFGFFAFLWIGRVARRR